MTATEVLLALGLFSLTATGLFLTWASWKTYPRGRYVFLGFGLAFTWILSAWIVYDEGYRAHREEALASGWLHHCTWNTYFERKEYRWGPHVPFNYTYTGTFVLPVHGCMEHICRRCRVGASESRHTTETLPSGVVQEVCPDGAWREEFPDGWVPTWY